MLVHRAPDGTYGRCRAEANCPYGGPVGQTLTRERRTQSGELLDKSIEGYEHLPIVSIGEGKHHHALTKKAYEAKTTQLPSNTHESTDSATTTSTDSTTVNNDNYDWESKGWTNDGKVWKKTVHVSSTSDEVPATLTKDSSEPRAGQRRLPPVKFILANYNETTWHQLSNKQKARALDEECQRISDALGIGWGEDGWKVRTTDNEAQNLTADHASKRVHLSNRYLSSTKLSTVLEGLLNLLKNLWTIR